jgi:hypothetical protein
MTSYPRWPVRRWLIWLLAAALLTSIPGALQPQPAAADRSGAPQAAPAPRAVPCRQNVYPLMPAVALLADNQPAWYQPVTMASLGLSPDADEADIPGLNTTTPNSPRFRVGELFPWVLWRASNDPWAASEPLAPKLTGAGTLSDGFVEYKRTLSMNGVLDAGDWLAYNYYGNVQPPVADLHAALTAHIAAKTRMILPAYDSVEHNDIGFPPIYRMQRFIEVRLLNYEFATPEGWSGYLEFALLDANKVCMSTAALYMPRTARSAPSP